MSAPKFYWVVICNCLQDGGQYIATPHALSEIGARLDFSDDTDEIVAEFRTEAEADVFAIQMHAKLKT